MMDHYKNRLKEDIEIRALVSKEGGDELAYGRADSKGRQTSIEQAAHKYK